MHGSSKVWWDEEKQIIRQAPSGLQDAKLAESVIKRMFSLLVKHPGAGILVDGKNVSFMSKSGGEMFRQCMLHPQFTRIAFLNISATIQVDISYLVNTFSDPEQLLSKFQLFNSEQKALEWLTG